MLKIYGVPFSVHTRKVIVAARIKGLPFESIPVVPVVPTSLPANWHSLSPTGLIPVLVDGDFTLPDSAAICAYLERMRPKPSLYPADPRGHARALWLEQYAGGTLFETVVRPLLHEVLINPKVRNIPTDRVRVDGVLIQAMPEVYGYLESVSGDGYLAGPALSVADVAVASNLVNAQYVGFTLDRSRYPRLAALFDRVIRVPEMIEALKAEQSVVQQMGLTSEFLRTVLT